jgi:alpha-amylase/alpha-mannosidase (GH57 family)
MPEIYHALGLHFHQPLGNLLALHHQPAERWEARQILWAYDRPTRVAQGWEDVARLHFSLSGTLLKQFEDPVVRATFADLERAYHLLDTAKAKLPDGGRS